MLKFKRPQVLQNIISQNEWILNASVPLFDLDK